VSDVRRLFVGVIRDARGLLHRERERRGRERVIHQYIDQLIPSLSMSLITSAPPLSLVEATL
jgi:hypothetical protein